MISRHHKAVAHLRTQRSQRTVKSVCQEERQKKWPKPQKEGNESKKEKEAV